MPSIPCPHCGRTLNVPDAAVGKTGRCPGCKSTFTAALPPPPPLPEPAAIADAPPAPRPKGRRKAKQRKPTTRRLGWPVYAAGGAVVVVGLGLIVWMAGGLFGGGRPTGAAAVAPPPSIPDVGAATMPPPDGWAMTPDPGGPVPEYEPAFRLVGGHTIYSLAFAGPGSRQMALLVHQYNDIYGKPVPGRPPLEWVRADAGREEPLARVPLTGLLPPPKPAKPPAPGSPEERTGWLTRIRASLDPSGDRLAVADPNRPGRVVVWAADGQRAAELAVGDAEVDWLGLSGDTLVALCGGRLTLRQVSNGRPLGAGVDGATAAVFSPGRRWVAVATADGVQVVKTADGGPAGRVGFPPDGKPQGGEPPAVAVSPDGSTLGAAVRGADAHFVFAWDAATGKPRAGVLFPHRDRTALPATTLRLLDGRTALLDGHYPIDLEFGGVYGVYGVYDDPRSLREGTVKTQRFPLPDAPDGRKWWTSTEHRERKPVGNERFRMPAQRENPFEHATVFLAGRRPAAAGPAGTAVFRPGMGVKVEVVYSGGPEPLPSRRTPTTEDFRAAVEAGLVAELARCGVRSDPAAGTTVRLRIGRPGFYSRASEWKTVYVGGHIEDGPRAQGMGLEATLEIVAPDGTVVVSEKTGSSAPTGPTADDAAKGAALDQARENVLARTVPHLPDMIVVHGPNEKPSVLRATLRERGR